jgi:Skp family chaperone for outer membrane proteins
MKKIFLILVLFTIWYPNVFADNSYFIDFDKVLNSSKAGKLAQNDLKTKFDNADKQFKEQEEAIKKEETKIISQKKLITPEEYHKQVEFLRKKVTDLRKKKQTSFSSVAKSRNDAKKALLAAVNPIILKYMEDNNIRIVVDKKGVILGDKTLEITDQIIKTLNKEFPSLKIN